MTDGSLKTLVDIDCTDGEVKSVAISPNGRLVATGDRDKVRD